MVKMLAALSEIAGRLETGKSLKVVDKMRLIVIATVQSHAHPFNLLLFFYLAQHFLKAPDAAVYFWRQPNFAPKKLDEPSLAIAGLFDNIVYGENMRLGLKLFERKGDRRMSCKVTDSLFEKGLFENANCHPE